MKNIILVTILLGFLPTGCQPNEEFKASTPRSIVTEAAETNVGNSSNSNKSLKSNSNDDSPISFPESQLDKISEQFLFGTWKIDKLLGFNYIYNDASEYPKGQKVIGDNIIITKDLFSSEGIVNYKWYQYTIKNPKIYIDTVYSNAESFLVYSKVNRAEGNLGLNPSDIIRSITITNDKNDLYPFSLFIVNNERLILQLEATYFELKKINDK
ncbi:hypothetical protein [Schinkia azotoformans]|nr:hypothetical protein [Schinkia azotoformans]MEC1722104.1 hypothetical protein [Schinkia azotoformans]MED4415191.1 hypothetical protein [Schinkia azotoformans]